MVYDCTVIASEAESSRPRMWRCEVWKIWAFMGRAELGYNEFSFMNMVCTEQTRPHPPANVQIEVDSVIVRTRGTTESDCGRYETPSFDSERSHI